MYELFFKEFVFQLRKQLANSNKKGSPKGNPDSIAVEKIGLEPTTS